MKKIIKIIMGICLLLGLFYLAYELKSFAGIDIDKQRHAKDYIQVLIPLEKKAYAQEKISIPKNVIKLQNPEEAIPVNSIIKIDINKRISHVKYNVLGQNLIGYESNGYGIWNYKWDEPEPGPIKLAKEAGISTVRYPGGCGTHSFNWKDVIDPDRKSLFFGLDEFLEVCQQIGAEPVITVSYFTGTPNDASDLVEYLNSPADEEHPWALKRAQNGRKKPYNVKYFEIGNEIYHGDHKDIKYVLPEQYGKDFVEYYNTMKATDQDIQIGAVLHEKDWNRIVLEKVKEKIDFGIVHLYPTLARGKALERIPADDIFLASFALISIRDEKFLQNASKLLKEKAGKDVPIFVTEYNGGFVQEMPVPYRFTLGNALVNAELIHVFMKPENNVKMAHNWNYMNEYWGMISNGYDGDYRDIKWPYYQRANYYVFEMYAKHFGNYLIEAKVECNGYDFSKYISLNKFFKENTVSGKNIGYDLELSSWNIGTVPGVNTYLNEDVLEIDFIKPKTFNYYHSFKSVSVQPNTCYKLSGYIKTEDLIDNNGVCLEVQDARGYNATQFANSTEKLNGTTDWTYVEAIFETLTDSKGINIIARRIGMEGPLSGKAFLKDVKLKKFIPEIATAIPFISVNASISENKKTIYLMVVNKNLEEDEVATIDLGDFVPKEKAGAWILNGPAVDSTNEKRPHNAVKIREKPFKIMGSKFEYNFEPHSLTALEIYKQEDA